MRALLLAALILLTAQTPALAAATSGASDGPYVRLEPFVVNVQEGRRFRFIQVKMQVETAHPKINEALQTHNAAVRDALIMIFAHQDAQTSRTPQGREALRGKALQAIRDVMAQFVSNLPEPAEGEEQTWGVNAVYFTDFVVQ